MVLDARRKDVAGVDPKARGAVKNKQALKKEKKLARIAALARMTDAQRSQRVGATSIGSATAAKVEQTTDAVKPGLGTAADHKGAHETDANKKSSKKSKKKKKNTTTESELATDSLSSIECHKTKSISSKKRKAEREAEQKTNGASEIDDIFGATNTLKHQGLSSWWCFLVGNRNLTIIKW